MLFHYILRVFIYEKEDYFRITNYTDNRQLYKIIYNCMIYINSQLYIKVSNGLGRPFWPMALDAQRSGWAAWPNYYGGPGLHNPNEQAILGLRRWPVMPLCWSTWPFQISFLLFPFSFLLYVKCNSHIFFLSLFFHVIC